jgi:hypothetical protein
LLSISETSLVHLATNIRAASFDGASSSSGLLVKRFIGSYNLVHIIQLDAFKLAIRVPATGWGEGITATAARAMESQVSTLRLIATKTTIPVPQVYAFDTTSNNEIGASYICRSFLPGHRAAEVWFDSTLSTTLEDRRLRTLTTLSQALAQLSQFSFPKIGSIHENENGGVIVGPCYDWKGEEDGPLRIVASGPYDTATLYLRDHYVKTNTRSVWGIAEAKVAEAVV